MDWFDAPAQGGNGDGLLQIAELSGATAADDKDSDGRLDWKIEDMDVDGKLDPPGFEVNTGNPNSPVYIDFQSFIISVELAGSLELVDMFELGGVFMFQLDLEGLKVFADAHLY
ncbi:MAG: hypothetical protein GTN93_12815, partial [Anaerolineae bacterium]|nr:hypothetical protein [Anaerolineae bacterium]